MAKATKRVLDFSKVKERGQFNPKHQPEGDYLARISSVIDAETKEGKPQWVFSIKVGTGTYPYRCQFAENVLWKIRNLFEAAGKSVSKKRLNVEPELIVGRDIGVTLGDHWYEDKLSSEIVGVFPTSELPAGEYEEPTDDEEDEEEEIYQPPTAPAEEEEEEDEEEEEEAPVAKVKKTKKKKTKVAVPDEDSDDLEELDIDDM
jgi:hypothetical protein